MPTTNQSPSPPSLCVFDAVPCTRCGMGRDSAEAVTYGSVCEDCWASQFHSTRQPSRASLDRVLMRSDAPHRKEFPW